MLNHSLPTPLSIVDVPLSTESVAYWSRRNPATCVVYVHGFGGRAVDTWGEFAEIALNQQEFANVDLVFLGYESRSRTAAFNAGVMYQAICALSERPEEVIRQVGGPSRSTSFAYKKIVLVGHSLGGALVRDVAMSAKEHGKPWAEKLSLALFAPAHLGANVIELVELSLGFLKYLGPIQAALRVNSPVLNDLRVGSKYLTDLLAQANRLGKHCTTQAKLVVHASNDKIVDQNVFFLDPEATPYAPHDHRSCCKPKRAVFESPVKHLSELLK
ncbi:alpha-beta hydrolase superfamily lysophospholipase [Rhizobium sp. BK226]|uniref:alpha/beta hydrolase n=1 Tax=Rhizobium sp. BK226 TaxID=2587075 RepID=UPI00161AA44E|nr:alpha/beta fold hydrolase [Rhizobium sp. BK226]MBB4112759.1 alpha-beta hydrolase superfamily lysophospholipase [Rhizobium sp. BK226]